MLLVRVRMLHKLCRVCFILEQNIKRYLVFSNNYAQIVKELWVHHSKNIWVCLSTRVISQWMSLVLDTWIEKNNHFHKWYDLIPLQTLFYFQFCPVEPASVWLFDSGIASLMLISSQESLRRDMQSQREEREWVAFHSVKGYWGAHSPSVHSFMSPLHPLYFPSPYVVQRYI